MTALLDRTGATLPPFTGPVRPSMKTSSRTICGLYDVQLRLSSPWLWSVKRFSFARIGRWQPKQPVVHDVWHVKHSILPDVCASSASLFGSAPQLFPSVRIVLARAAAA